MSQNSPKGNCRIHQDEVGPFVHCNGGKARPYIRPEDPPSSVRHLIGMQDSDYVKRLGERRNETWQISNRTQFEVGDSVIARHINQTSEVRVRHPVTRVAEILILENN